MVKKVLFFLIITSPLAAAPDPFSKITVTSKNATIQKDKKNKSLIYLQYSDDVFVKFADKSTISSDKLELIVEKEDVKKIIFRKNVHLNRNNQKAQADLVEVFVPEKRCELRGHVTIQQTKQQENDIPVITNCEHAQLQWDSEEIKLSGSNQKPVSTVIKLDGKLRLLRKKS